MVPTVNLGPKVVIPARRGNVSRRHCGNVPRSTARVWHVIAGFDGGVFSKRRERRLAKAVIAGLDPAIH
jgi:hypothetical protein